jgi:hypothetical protein
MLCGFDESNFSDDPLAYERESWPALATLGTRCKYVKITGDVPTIVRVMFEQGVGFSVRNGYPVAFVSEIGSFSTSTSGTIPAENGFYECVLFLAAHKILLQTRGYPLRRYEFSFISQAPEVVVEETPIFEALSLGTGAPVSVIRGMMDPESGIYLNCKLEEFDWGLLKKKIIPVYQGYLAGFTNDIMAVGKRFLNLETLYDKFAPNSPEKRMFLVDMVLKAWTNRKVILPGPPGDGFSFFPHVATNEEAIQWLCDNVLEDGQGQLAEQKSYDSSSPKFFAFALDFDDIGPLHADGAFIKLPSIGTWSAVQNSKPAFARPYTLSAELKGTLGIFTKKSLASYCQGAQGGKVLLDMVHGTTFHAVRQNLEELSPTALKAWKRNMRAADIRFGNFKCSMTIVDLILYFFRFDLKQFGFKEW